MSTNFSGSPHTMGFVAFSCTMENWWENPCISHMLNYPIGWESNGKKAPMLWEMYDYQFSRHSAYHGFCCISLYCGKLMGNSCVSLMMTLVNFFLWQAQIFAGSTTESWQIIQLFSFLLSLSEQAAYFHATYYYCVILSHLFTAYCRSSS